MKQFPGMLLVVVSLVPSALAQQTGVAGRVTDPSGAVISGAVVDVQQAGGGHFAASTNTNGLYQVPALSASDYIIIVTAQGFDTVKKHLTLLVGQTATIDVVLPVERAAQSVVVEAEDNAIETTTSQVSGTITPAQVQSIPINGRNYMELAILVPGVRANAITNGTPLGGTNTGKFQIDLDGLQVTQDTADASFGQPRYSQDAISQFQIVTNRFDATVGRSAGVYVNAQTRSGTNTLHGSAFGYFRNDTFNAADPIAHQVLPFSDQQFGGTAGGPVRRDRLWYFGSYEGEHQPKTAVTTPPQTGTTVSHSETFSTNEYLGRGDYQLSAKDHIFLRADGYTYNDNYFGVSGTTDPSRAYDAQQMSYSVMGTWSRVIGSGLVNEARVGFAHFQWQNNPLVSSLQLAFPLVTVGGPYNYPQRFFQGVQQYRDDLYYLRGTHSIKAGVEFLDARHTGYFQQNVRGTATCGTNPSSWSSAFPNGTSDPSTWNWSVINAACNGGSGLSFVQGFGNFNVDIPRPELGLWIEDDWKVFPRLTLNLGLRYDNDLGVFDTGLALNNGLQTPKQNDNHELGPRIGFALDPTGTGNTVIRGGAGVYFADVAANQVIDEQIFNGVTTVQASESGSAASPVDLSDPFPGQNAQQIQTSTTVRQAVQPLGPNVVTPWALQMSFGAQRSLPFRITLAADYVHTRMYHDWIRLNANLLPNAANPQFNLNPSTKNTSGQYNVALQNFTNILQFDTPNQAGSIYDGLQVGVTKAASSGLTSTLAYTYSRLKDSTENPFYYPNKPFVSGMHDEWANSADDQRHTLTADGIYAWKYGLSLSGLFHFGSGNAFPTYLGTSQPTGYAPTYNRTFNHTQPGYRGQACSAGASCTVVYNRSGNNFLDVATGYWMTRRDALYGRNIYRVDTRVQKSFSVNERARVVVGVEAFNLFNHPNYGNYNGIITSPSYGQPASTSNNPVEFQARSLQFLGRFEF